MDKIKKKIVNHHKLKNEFAKYYGKISGMTGSFYVEKVKEIKKLVDTYQNTLDQVKPKFADENREYFRMIHLFGILDEQTSVLKEKFEYFSPSEHRLLQGLSSTFISDAENMFDSLLVFINTIEKKHQKYDAHIIEFCSMRILANFSIYESKSKFAEVREYYKQYRNSVSLYALVVQKIIDILYSGNQRSQEIASYILNEIESDKTDELRVAGEEFDGLTTNPPLQSFGLSPISETMSLKDIVHHVFSQSVPPEFCDNDLGNIANANGVCIILYVAIVHIPAYHILDTILERDRMPHRIGINRNVIEKLRTIKTLSKAEYNFGMHVYGSDQVPSVVVIKKISPKKYQVLGQSIRSEPIMSRFDIPFLIEYVKNPNKVPRMRHYNLQVLSELPDNMFLSQHVKLKEISELSEIDEVKFLRNNVLLRVLEVCREMDDGKNTIDDILHSTRIKDVIVQTIISDCYKFIKKGSAGDGSEFAVSEALASFTSHLSYITRGFARELYSPTIKVDHEQRDIMDAITPIIKNSISKIIGNKSNIYQSIIYKMLLIE